MWAVNQLARKEGKDYRALLKAGDSLRKAQEKVLGGESPEKLQEAAAAERELVDRLTEKGRALLDDGGHKPTDAMLRRVSGTLHAAATRPDLREAAESGRLEHEEETAGFGFDLLSGGVPRRRSPSRATTSGPASAGRRRSSVWRRHARSSPRPSRRRRTRPPR